MKKADRVLIIDDEATFRMLMVEWLSSCGYECHEAANGSEGLNRALDEHWDLILSDIIMPGLTGIDLVRIMKSFKNRVPVIMISAERKSETVKMAFREGAYDFIFKPIAMDELEMTIARALERSRLERENEQYKSTLEQRVGELAKQISALTIGSILALARALEAKDPYTNGHSQRVAEYGVLIAQQLAADYKTQERIRIAGQLHDIGKIGLSESVLHKCGKLTDEEYQLVKMHPVVGSEILTPVIKDAFVIDAVKHHHENFDGSGYPDRLAGEEIPLEARILAVADAYDAMTTDRAYRRAKTYQAAMAELERCAGKQFDPMIVKLFASIDRKKICREEQITALPQTANPTFAQLSF
jgi:response regulator RpfG family c-di-GMP phosphodiesterase